MATYAIGDIQGCFHSLQSLLERVGFNPAHDRLWFVGDLINRGPRSLETLRFVRDLGPTATTVLGNHDLYLLMVAEGAAKFRGKDDTLQAILDAPDRDELLLWLRHLPLCHTEEAYCLVHAGLLPQWSARQAKALSVEVENALQGPDYRDFVAHMWGSEPAAWSETLAGWPRLRVIVNAMTRMRFCTPDGVMDLHTKGELAKAPAGYLAWFDAPGRQSRDSVLVTGHWSALGLRLTDNHFSLDTGCLWGAKLTALRLEDRQVFQIDCAIDESVPLN